MEKLKNLPNEATQIILEPIKCPVYHTYTYNLLYTKQDKKARYTIEKNLTETAAAAKAALYLNQIKGNNEK